MRAWQARELGEPRDVLVLAEVPEPEPGRGPRARLPEPKGTSLEEFTENRYPASAVTPGLAESRGTRAPSA